MLRKGKTSLDPSPARTVVTPGPSLGLRRQCPEDWMLPGNQAEEGGSATSALALGVDRGGATYSWDHFMLDPRRGVASFLEPLELR